MQREYFVPGEGGWSTAEKNWEIFKERNGSILNGAERQGFVSDGHKHFQRAETIHMLESAASDCKLRFQPVAAWLSELLCYVCTVVF